MVEEWEAKALRMLEDARRLSEVHRRVLNYFLENISVGVIRSVKELKALGVEEAERVIEELVVMGYLEEGMECYNLAAPLRELVFRKRGHVRV